MGTSRMQTQATLPGFYERLVDTSVETLRHYGPRGRIPTPNNNPYYGCFSGGKDSCVIKELAEMAGVAIDWHYNVTTIDPPELIYFMREHHPDVIWERNKRGRNFFAALVAKGFPTRRFRWCCSEFKEGNLPAGRRVVFGIRAVESPRRAANWQLFTRHRKTGDYVVNPILHWRDDDVWRFIHERNLPYCTLYDEGWKRLGCIGCPMSGRVGRRRDFARWPGYERAWRRAFSQLWDRRAGTMQRNGNPWSGSALFGSSDEMFDWWVNDEPLPGTSEECQGQLEFWA